MFVLTGRVNILVFDRIVRNRFLSGKPEEAHIFRNHDIRRAAGFFLSSKPRRQDGGIRGTSGFAVVLARRLHQWHRSKVRRALFPLFFINIWSRPPGVRTSFLHRVRTEQRAAPRNRRRQLRAWVPVHASYESSKQVQVEFVLVRRVLLIRLKKIFKLRIFCNLKRVVRATRDPPLFLRRMHQREYQIPSTSSLPKVASVGEGLNMFDHAFLPPCQRMGIMAAFTDFDAFKQWVASCSRLVGRHHTWCTAHARLRASGHFLLLNLEGRAYICFTNAAGSATTAYSLAIIESCLTVLAFQILFFRLL